MSASATGTGARSGARAAAREALGLLPRLRALGALASCDEEGVLREADRLDSGAGDGDGDGGGPVGPLHGLPVVVKDCLDVAGLPTTGGTPALADHRPRRDCGAVRRLRAAGAQVVAKTTLHELSFGITSNNAWTGPVRNPYDLSLIPGGSSGGTAAAVAAGVVSAGLAADTGGSARLPAALCGVVGFRPTAGRYPSDGVLPISTTRDTVGVVARSVAGVQELDRVLAGEVPAGGAGGRPSEHVAGLTAEGTSQPGAGRSALDGVRLGVPAQMWADLDDGVERAARRALGALADAGATLVDVDLGEVLDLVGEVALPVALHELPRDLGTYLRAGGGPPLEEVRRAVASPDVAALWDHLEGDGAVDDARYRRALRDRETLRRRWAQALAGADLAAMVLPTSPLPARPIGQDATVDLRGRQVPTFATYIRHTDLAGAAGHPAISVPAGVSAQGLPVGLELDGAVGSDVALLDLAAALAPLLPPTPPPPTPPPPAPPITQETP